MKFSRTFGTVRRLNDFDLNVIGILCVFNRASDEVIKAEEYLTRRSGNRDNIESRAVFSVTDNMISHGYYILFNNDAMVVAMGISNENSAIDYHMRDESHQCETRNTVIEKDHEGAMHEMFRVSVAGELGKGIMDTFGLKESCAYQISHNSEVPVKIIMKRGQIIFAQ